MSADKQVLLVAGIRHNIKGLHNIPSTIRINSIHAPRWLEISRPGTAAKTERKMSHDSRRNESTAPRPRRSDRAAGRRKCHRAGAGPHRAIDSIAASVGDAQLVRDAKYGENTCTAEQLALKAMQKQAALGAKHLKDAANDNAESGAANVGAAPNGGEEGSEADDKARSTPSSASTTPPRTEVRSNEQETG